MLTGMDLQALHPNAPENSVAVAISHSCDIANENLEAEPTVEFILAVPIPKCDGNFAGAKNPRKLHLRTLPAKGPQGLELLATQKINFEKTKLNPYQPANTPELAPGELPVLQSWLAARYKRQALPDALQERLRPLFTKMEKQAAKKPSAILGYWLEYDPREELPPEEAYEVGISVVYSIDDLDFADFAGEIAVILSGEKIEGVDLSRCAALSEEEFTIRDLRHQVQYRAEHLSYRTEPHGPVV